MYFNTSYFMELFYKLRILDFGGKQTKLLCVSILHVRTYKRRVYSHFHNILVNCCGVRVELPIYNDRIQGRFSGSNPSPTEISSKNYFYRLSFMLDVFFSLRHYVNLRQKRIILDTRGYGSYVQWCHFIHIVPMHVRLAFYSITHWKMRYIVSNSYSFFRLFLV